jgi:hypothetical protein
MLVYHPLSGHADADEFHFDANRLCDDLSPQRNLINVKSFESTSGNRLE